ncbi:M1 family metallopeptidase [Roseivirga sp. E12]|uniref:M1 family metallopeptidase n=1 Tax=Roseivirga sp. E12 TaxID=2819237 RepID=UPI001ABC87DB|nr:M1 family metallopeptidase [Roseivirga sp. E12]MBO3697787.1 M1 family metallopeptidase [Roseivirga sp. E12]
MRRTLIFALLLSSFTTLAQDFSRQDSLRGSITPERAWWNLTYYHLDIEVLPEQKAIRGTNTIQYKVIVSSDELQVDLQAPLRITKVTQNGRELDFRSDGNAHFVRLWEKQMPGEIYEIIVHYQGKPKEAVRAPWDGGFSWKKDSNGADFIATSCQGLGASVWWPNKDHMYDEVDSMDISVEVPEHLTNVSNGRLVRTDHHKEKKTKTYHWAVKNPINNYGVNLNIGDYVSWKDTYKGEKGDLDVTYWALKVDRKKARKTYKEVPRMLAAFEHWFGPYPFYEDGYQLVQAPYLGMEHQSSITYGNGFQNGYLGRDLSTTGWGMKFDFIIVHESGHEWFANNITHKDHADMWIHESFTNYSESLFLDYHFGKEAGQEYVRGTRTEIGNKKPMIGPYEVNYGDYPIDVYYKGGNMLNTLRTIINDDEQWRQLLRSLGKEFYHKTVWSADFEAYISKTLDLKLAPFFNQYLRDPRLPVFEYFFKDGNLHHRWVNTIDTFDMPLDITVNGNKMRISPTGRWQRSAMIGESLSVDPNYYIGILKSR